MDRVEIARIEARRCEKCGRLDNQYGLSVMVAPGEQTITLLVCKCNDEPISEKPLYPQMSWWQLIVGYVLVWLALPMGFLYLVVHVLKALFRNQ